LEDDYLDDEEAKEKSDEDENAETVDLDLHVPLPNRGYLLYQFCIKVIKRMTKIMILMTRVYLFESNNPVSGLQRNGTNDDEVEHDDDLETGLITK